MNPLVEQHVGLLCQHGLERDQVNNGIVEPEPLAVCLQRVSREVTACLDSSSSSSEVSIGVGDFFKLKS